MRRRRPGTRQRALATRLLLGLLVLLVLTGAWLALGLLEARRDLRVGAAGVRTELAAAEAALAGAGAGAGGHLRAYAADPALERLLARHRLDGAPPAAALTAATDQHG